MKEKEKETKPFLCPFCGAPQRKFIPHGTVQVRCSYCSGVILVPPWMGGETLRCVSHPERLAVGICNDCGRNFCGKCLHLFHLETRYAKAILHLDPACLGKRYEKRADSAIWGGILIVVFGVFLSIVSLLSGVPFIILGISVIAYGVFKSRQTPTELTVDEALTERKRIEAHPRLRETVDSQKLYDELVTQYVHRWGPRLGTDLLKNEVKAYTSRGVSFSEAVRIIYTRERAKSWSR